MAAPPGIPLLPLPPPPPLLSASLLLRSTYRRWKEYFEGSSSIPPLHPSTEEAEAEDSSITQAEVTEVVRKLLSGKVRLGVDEIPP
ncbi:hypothetical protein L3Q82_022413 [Scortum barcoo]|uniref:Uncharacterized protein n=1 Tax=Scortum barcoo TaxID=214431 RepID=A0ACB8X190_9TELE|nr:hypothetical protein L3Q82_022413 [Scortum barcoo]